MNLQVYEHTSIQTMFEFETELCLIVFRTYKIMIHNTIPNVGVLLLHTQNLQTVQILLSTAIHTNKSITYLQEFSVPCLISGNDKEVGNQRIHNKK